METQIATITPTDEVIQSLAEKGITATLITELAQYKELKVDARIENGTVIYNQEQFKAVSEARKKIKNTRVSIEKTCKSFRDVHNAINKEYSAKEKEFVGVLSPVEDALQEEESKVENLKEQIRKDQEAKDEAKFKARVMELEALGMTSREAGAKYVLNDFSVQTVDLKFMPDHSFLNIVSGVKFAVEKAKEEQAKIEAERKAEADRIAKIEAAQKAEAARLEAQRKEQEEAARKVREEQEAMEKAIRDEQAKMEAEKKRIENEKLAEEQAKKRAIEIEEARKEAAAQAIKDAEEKVKREAAEKAEKERKAAELAAKKDARKPDKKKLIEWLDKIVVSEKPVMKTDDGQSAATQIEDLLQSFETSVKKIIETL